MATERSGASPSVLFLFEQQGAWTRYRCDHLVEALALSGVRGATARFPAATDSYDIVVLNRVEWSADVDAVVRRARGTGAVVLFGTDDLIFEPELHRHLAAFDGWPEEARKNEIDRLVRFRQTLEAGDGAIVSTEPLREHAARRLPRTEVVFNAVSQEMIQLADRALRRRRLNLRRRITIAYFSGTRTHRRDFLEAADGLLWALENDRRVEFLAVGKVELDERFERFGERVRRLPIQPWQKLPELLARVDINIAPLERANPFAECKSCVKYLEAGLVGVPTIASARPDFVRVIEHRRNGLLADTSDEWREAIGGLIESSELRARIGTSAAEDVRKHHSTRAAGRSIFAALARWADRKATT